VAWLAGHAGYLRARLEELAGRPESAARGYATVAAAWRVVPEVAVAAAAARARLLEATGGSAAAAEAWIAVLEFPFVDDERGIVNAAVLEAPVRAARLWRRGGRDREADSLLAEHAVRCELELEGRRWGRLAPELWAGLAEMRSARGEIDAALAALRGSLAEPERGRPRSDAILALASRSLAAGRPDSALPYARWAERELEGEDQLRAIMLTGEVWKAAGEVDSALAAYERFLGLAPSDTDSAALARFRRGDVLETAGRWERARSEFRALSAAQPTHPLGLESLVRVVRHHAEHGETELARIEATRAVDHLDRIIAMHFDEDVQLQARRTRAEVLRASGDLRSACLGLQDVWKRSPDSVVGAAAGLAAAGLAESSLADRKLALDLYRALSGGRAGADLKDRARAGVERLEHADRKNL
jgi:tetratricopeptide (TPR) repeat protein